MKKKGLTAEQKLTRYLAEKSYKGKNCHHCGYWQEGYCRDLDVHTDVPVCSDENYYA